MKKMLCFAFLMMIINITNVFANSTIPTLDEIVNKFNTQEDIVYINNNGGSAVAKTENNKIIVETKSSEGNYHIEFPLNGNILSSTVKQDDFNGALIIMYLINAIGLCHGYNDGDLQATLNSEEILNYEVENEGVEMIINPDGQVNFKTDISKKIPLVDVTNVYIGVEDLDDLKEFISGNGSAEMSKGNVWFNKSGYYGENTLLVAEKNELTKNTYNSILSIIEVMFESQDVVDYFKNNYKSIGNNKEFTGVKIEVNPVKDDWENGLIPDDSGYKFVRISIDKNDINELNLSGNINSPENPDTGEVHQLTILFVILVIVNIVFLYFRKKNLFHNI